MPDQERAAHLDRKKVSAEFLTVVSVQIFFSLKKNPANHVDESCRLNPPQQTNIMLDRKLTVDLPELVFGN